MTSDEWARYEPNIVWIGGRPWRRSGRVLEPLGFPHLHDRAPPDRAALRGYLRRRPGVVARWTDRWDQGAQGSPWWWVCCDDPDYSVEAIRSKRGRRGIRRGLRSCVVEPMAPSRFVELSYPILVESLKRYGVARRHFPVERGYRDRWMRASEYGGRTFWGASVGGDLAAYAICSEADGGAIIGVTKSRRALRSHCPNNALLFELTRHYLRDRGLRFVTNGARTLLHPTEINSFLERMNYRRVPARLNLEFGPWISGPMRRWLLPVAGAVGRSLPARFSGVGEALQALSLADELSRLSEHR